MRQLSEVFRRFASRCVRDSRSRLSIRHGKQRRSRWGSATPSTETLEVRQLLAATPIAGLSDEFDSVATTDRWQRLNEIEGWNADQLNLYDIDTTQSGRMVQQPHTTVWYQNWRGPMAFQNVTGDFSFTTQVHVTDRDDIGGSDADSVPGDAQFSLAGAMIRTPRDITNPAADWTPGSMADDGTNDGENYVFLSLGYGAAENEFSLEVKTTRNSDSQLELTSLGQNANSVTVQISRIGSSIITMYQQPGQEWQVHRRYSRPDMPETLQVGLVSYTDWTKASDFDPFTQNSTVLIPGIAGDPTPGEAFNPDITAGFEYARYARPDVPDAFSGADLSNPTAVSDAQLLSFLGSATNIVDDGSGQGGEESPFVPDPVPQPESPLDSPGDNPDSPSLAIGMNLGMVNDWTHSWIFRDAFKLARTFTTRSVNTTTWEFGWNGPPEMDADGWVRSLPADTINSRGETISYFADSILFSEGGNPAGLYRAEWSGEGEMTFGATAVETGTTEDGRSYVLLDVAEDQTLHIRISETNPDDYIRDIQLFMPDYEGQPLEMENWQPGQEESPFHPLFLERLQPFETLRFMQWQQVNEDGRDVLTVDDLRPVSHASQGSTDRASYNGVSVEYQVQLANDLGANAWFNMPHQADDGYVRAFAEYVRDNIHDDARILVEYSNEVWNYAFGFEANAWIGEQQDLPENAGLSFVDVWAQEARRDFAIWSDVFIGQEDRLIRVAAGQQNNPWLTGQLLERMNGEFDAVSSTSYAGLGTANVDFITETTTQDDIIDWVLENSVPFSLQTQAAHTELAASYSEALGRDIPFVTYEGGSHLDAFGTEYQDLVHSVQGNPRFTEVYAALLNGMESLGIDMHMQYVFTSQGEPTPWGEFGVLHEMDMPLEDAHEYRALVDFMNGDLNPPTVAVAIEATDSTAHELGDTATFTVTRTDALALADLTVSYQVSGTATGGVDYEALSGSVVIAAGETSAEIIVTPLLESSTSGDEGAESILVTLTDGEGYESGGASAEVTIIDNVAFTIADQTMSHTAGSLQIALPSELGGQPATHSVRIAQNLVADLNEEHSLFVFDPDFGFDWGGQQERWLQGDGGYYFILSNGEFRLWQGSFENSQLLGTLDAEYYDNPERITLAEPIAIQLEVSASSLTISPAMNFVGDFDVELTTTVAGAVSSQTFNVAVTNQAPTIGALNDLSMMAGSTRLLELEVADADADQISVTARVAASESFRLVDEFGLYGEAGSNDWGLNWSGQHQERWVRGHYETWFFILPDGSVNHWQGSFENSLQVGSVSTEMYENPQRLLGADGPAVSATFVDGQLLLTSEMRTGTFEVTVEVDDQFTTTSTRFEVTVTNQTPELNFSDVSLAAGESVEISLPTLDADGHSLSYDVSVIDPSLPQLDIDFEDQGSFYHNYLGNNERWLRDTEGQWYFLLEDGIFYRWQGSFAASSAIVELGVDYYENPDLILNPPAPAVTATIEEGVLTLTAAGDFTGSRQLQVRVTDGIDSVEQTVVIRASSLAVVSGPALDSVFAGWEGLE